MIKWIIATAVLWWLFPGAMNGLPVVLHCVGELAINQMKLVHLAVSTPNATLDHQTLYDYLADDIGARLLVRRITRLPGGGA